MNRKILVILAGAATLIALIALIFAPAPQTASAQGPTPAPQPPVAVLKVVPVWANAAGDKNAMTATLTYITDTKVGPAKTTVAVGAAGLSNTPVNVPVHLAVSAKDPKNTGKPTWSLIKPADSKAAIKDPAAMETEFTPDVVGAYMVSVSLKGDTGTSAARYAFFNAGTFIGMETGNCKQCHPTKVAEWAKTGHASILKDNIDNSRSPTSDSHYTEGCIRCHTTGFFLPAAKNGGFADAQEKTGWKVPTWEQINAAGKKTGPSNWDAAPAEIKNMGNIQCEQCHGPANEHVKNGANVMASSMNNGTCNVCHAGGGHHIRGIEILSSKHTTGTSFEEITGPARLACARCHSAEGFVSFVANPKNQAAWKPEEGSIGCATCHDPHSDANYAQLRIAGKPVEIPFEVKKDVGLPAICFPFHNNRGVPENAVKGSYPHYSSAAEMLSDSGGVTYGATVPNSPHSMMVGAAPVPNAATPGTFLWSKSNDKKGNVPGPCVYCHMWAGITDAKDPNFMKVGDHSFNMVSPDGKFDYGAACKSCHGEVKDFNLKAKADYDGSGAAGGVQDEIKGLLNATWKALEAKGLKKQESGYPYATVPADASDSVKQAWYNFRYVYGVMWGAAGPGGEGKAAAIHNFKRSCALLQLSLKDLGATPAGAADCTK